MPTYDTTGAAKIFAKARYELRRDDVGQTAAAASLIQAVVEAARAQGFEVDEVGGGTVWRVTLRNAQASGTAYLHLLGTDVDVTSFEKWERPVLSAITYDPYLKVFVARKPMADGARDAATAIAQALATEIVTALARDHRNT
ncbi:MAG TPA: hypothetical protein VFG30_04720 [Polyangiales bacterium]|jgi:hypothetical protein|nr:hypothetical protein [Polyangiales bacterium]